MKIRILSAAVGICVAVGLIILGSFFPLVVELSLSVIAAMCVYEGLSAKNLSKKFRISIPCIGFAFAFNMLYRFSFYPLIVFAFFIAIFSVMIFNYEKFDYQELSHALTITIMCTLGIWSVTYLYDITKGMVGIFYVVLALTTPWLADSGAYFGGSLLGKRKLCPKISPKKTVEGAVSGVIIGAILSALVGIIFRQFIFSNGEGVNFIFLAVFSLIGSVISIVGDLSFSLIKRSCGVKDYGNLIPGHGGMLDRFDSVIFTAPFLLIYNMYFPIISM